MLIPVETWTVFGVDDERGATAHVVSAYCPLRDLDVVPEADSPWRSLERLSCSNGLRRCEYFHHADFKGIECIYNEVEADVIDGETLSEQ